MAKVSVIISTFNYGRFLGESIQSVLDQTFTDFELIIVDDGSTDNTREIVAAFKDPRIRYIYQENCGQGSGRNTGIKASCGEYIAFHDADDIWLPQNLEIKVKVLDSRPEIALVCSDLYYFDNQTGVTLGRLWHDRPFHYWIDPVIASQRPRRELLFRGLFCMPVATVMRRLVFDKAGYFDESLRIFEDWDMFFRIFQHFPTIETIDIPLIKVRMHDISTTANWDRVYFGEIDILNKAAQITSFTKEEMKLVKRRLAPQHLRYGRQAILNGDIAAGRKALLASIKADPRAPKSYVYLVMSIIGKGRFQTLRDWKKWLGQHIGRRRLPGIVQSMRS